MSCNLPCFISITKDDHVSYVKCGRTVSIERVEAEVKKAVGTFKIIQVPKERTGGWRTPFSARIVQCCSGCLNSTLQFSMELLFWISLHFFRKHSLVIQFHLLEKRCVWTQKIKPKPGGSLARKAGNMSFTEAKKMHEPRNTKDNTNWAKELKPKKQTSVQ